MLSASEGTVINNGQNAFDESDGTYATTSVNNDAI